MAKDLNSELFEQPSKEFKKHLEIPENSRILFSGIYGIGKTTFINHFFKEETQNKYFDKTRFNVVYLYPVNYSISTTEDIFKYIKLDILHELLTNYDLDFSNEKISKRTIAAFSVVKNIHNILSPLLLLLPDGTSDVQGEALFSFFQSYKTLAESLIESVKNLSKKENKISQIEDFANSEFNKEGSLYEQNPITHLIIDLINQLKEEEKETVLIIDDLDRLDPTHVFRLFNIFAAHFDLKQESHNKFGFDKVIFVCDAGNIRRLFSSYFGTEVSFSGYIDKFYSKNIFKYDNFETLKYFVERLIHKVEFYSENHKASRENFIRERMKEDSRTKMNLIQLLTVFILNENLNLRAILKLNNEIIIKKRDIQAYRGQWPVEGLPIVFEIEALSLLFSTKEDIVLALQVALKRENLTRGKNNKDKAYLNLAKSAVELLGYWKIEDSQIAYPIDNSSNYYSLMMNMTEFNIVENTGDSPVLDDGLNAAELYIRAINYLARINEIR